MKVRTGVALGLAAVALAVPAAPASAAETRAEYVAQADRACKAAFQDMSRVARRFKPAETDIFEIGNEGAGKLTKKEQRAYNKVRIQTSRLLSRLNKVFGRMLTTVAYIPIPNGDEATVSIWLDGLRDYKRLTDRANRALKHDKLGVFLVAFLQSLQALERGMVVVKDWGFRQCPAEDLDDLAASSGGGGVNPFGAG